MRLPFQLDRPVFANQRFIFNSKIYNISDHFPWKELSIKWEDVYRMYNDLKLVHDERLEIKAKVGDGLEQLDVEALHKLVDTINQKVKKNTDSQRKFDAMKCKKSKIADKQRGLIRSWRRKYGEMENL